MFAKVLAIIAIFQLVAYNRNDNVAKLSKMYTRQYKLNSLFATENKTAT